jgi:hypothetical protein
MSSSSITNENQQINQNDDNESISIASTSSTITERNTSNILKKLMDKIDSLEKKIENNNNYQTYLYGNTQNSSNPPYLSWSYITDLFWNTNKLDESKKNENGDYIISAFDFKELIFSICYFVFIATCFLISFLRKNKFSTITNTPIDYI